MADRARRRWGKVSRRSGSRKVWQVQALGRKSPVPSPFGLAGDESFDIHVPVSGEGLIDPRCDIKVTATKPDGKKIEFTTRCRIDTPVEAEYYRNGGVLHTVLRRLLNESRKPVGV